jgi:DegV family protein with EDD domain
VRGTVSVLVDSTAGVGPELAERWGVGVVPLTLAWGERTYRDGIDLLPAEFYAKLEREDSNPVTAAPNPAEFEKAYRQALADGADHVLVVTASRELSATYENARAAVAAVGDDLVSVLDSRQGAASQALIAAHAARIGRQGGQAAAALAAAREAGAASELFIAVDTLRYLRRSGRISGAQASLGEVVRMKPILTFNDGRLRVVEKPRTQRRALERLVERAAAQPGVEHALVVYAEDPALGEALASALRPRLAGAEIDVGPVSGVVGGHTGPGLVGVGVRRRAQS